MRMTSGVMCGTYIIIYIASDDGLMVLLMVVGLPQCKLLSSNFANVAGISMFLFDHVFQWTSMGSCIWYNYCYSSFWLVNFYNSMHDNVTHKS